MELYFLLGFFAGLVPAFFAGRKYQAERERELRPQGVNLLREHGRSPVR